MWFLEIYIFGYIALCWKRCSKKAVVQQSLYCINSILLCSSVWLYIFKGSVQILICLEVLLFSNLFFSSCRNQCFDLWMKYIHWAMILSSHPALNDMLFCDHVKFTNGPYVEKERVCLGAVLFLQKQKFYPCFIHSHMDWFFRVYLYILISLIDGSSVHIFSG